MRNVDHPGVPLPGEMLAFKIILLIQELQEL
jgi:hypothetical protein